jgi:hypothetical protein
VEQIAKTSCEDATVHLQSKSGLAEMNAALPSLLGWMHTDQSHPFDVDYPVFGE